MTKSEQIKSKDKKLKKEPYKLFWVDSNLKDAGVKTKCFKYILSSNGSQLTIIYFDYLLDEQHLNLFRTSRHSYRVYFNGKLNSFRTAKTTSDYIINSLNKFLTHSEYLKSLSVYDNLTLDTITHNKKLELFRKSIGSASE